MAELVNRNNEEILPQFEEIIKLKLFTAAEMREVIQKHVQFEYKAVRREKSVADFQQYITYKADFLKLVRIRMKLKNVNKKDRRKVEHMLVRHISKLYNTMVKYYSTDTSLWLNYIDFMTKEKDYAKVVVLYDSLLNFHLGDVDLFINAAKFMMKYIRDVDLARKTLFKGIRIHKRNTKLYLELFKVELDFAARKRKEAKEDMDKLNTDPVLCGKTAEVVCLSALQVIPEIDFKFSLLDICTKYKFARALQKKIYRMLKADHCKDPEMWKKIALMQLDGINFESIDMMGLKSKDLFKQRVWRCFHIFLKAVKVVPTEEMWFHYIDTFFELLKSHPDKHEFINKFLLKLLPRSNVQNLLKEEHYLCWIENAETHQPLENLIGFIDGSIKLYPQSVKLWLKKLKNCISRQSTEELMQTFKLAHQSLKDEQSQCLLWQHALDSSSNFPLQEIAQFFENMMKESPVTYPSLRPLYLDWVISKNNPTLARNTFASISQIPPYNIDLYKKMINSETSRQPIDVKYVRELYEKACLYFGSNKSDLWMNYVEFEQQYGDASFITTVYWKAVKQLEPSLSDNFITEYSLFKTRC